ncbi:MAG: hypothetical protein ACFFG0_07715 [Candidatus Thorarchaeota archaeon]
MNTRKSGRGLSIIALLVGVAGLGLGLYTMFFSQSTPNSAPKSWYIKNDTFIYTNPAYDYISVSTLELNVSISTGEALYVKYSGDAFVEPQTFVTVYFEIDNVLIPTPSVSSQNPDATYASRVSVSLQMVNNSLVGTHVIRIVIRGSNISNRFQFNTLFAQAINLV